MPATLPELVRGLTGAVTREDAKKLARLHGHSWKTVLKAMKRRARRMPAALRLKYSPEAVEARGGFASRVLAEMGRSAEPSVEESIAKACDLVGKYGGHPDHVVVDGVEVIRGGEAVSNGR